VNLVVNVDLPPDAATYVHRVGRTGRFGTSGVAVALVTPDELATLRGYLAEVVGGECVAACGHCGVRWWRVGRGGQAHLRTV